MPTNEYVALKIYQKSALQDTLKKNSLLREIHVLETLDHPNIIQIYDCIDTGKEVFTKNDIPGYNGP